MGKSHKKFALNKKMVSRRSNFENGSREPTHFYPDGGFSGTKDKNHLSSVQFIAIDANMCGTIMRKEILLNGLKIQ